MQLLVASQLEWLVRDTFTQGLWAICKFSECHLRDSVISLSALVMHLSGAVVLLLSALISLAIVSSKTTIARCGDAKRLGIIANVQFIAGADLKLRKISQVLSVQMIRDLSLVKM
uniref:Uncharacterized protein n=1 Tax=Parascaris univalens TaxID=6257 RepID=A0A915CI20_PARUN